MTRSIGHLLIHALTIQRSTSVDNGHGGFEEVYQDVSTVSGRVNPVTSKDLASLGKEESRVTHAIYFQPKEDVRIGDKVRFDGREFFLRVKNIEPSIPIYRKIMAEEIQEG